MPSKHRYPIFPYRIATDLRRAAEARAALEDVPLKTILDRALTRYLASPPDQASVTDAAPAPALEEEC